MISALLRDDAKDISDKAFAENISNERRKGIKQLLLNPRNEELLEVIVGTRAAAIVPEIGNVFDKNGDITESGRDFL